ncbi:MAG: glycerophosphodiester phosphodiesterase [Rhodoferax sp.]
MTVPPNTPWPYPRWIAHRGGGSLAPENTLAAFRLGLQYGWRMAECDVKLSADGIPFLLHDATLARTTNAVQALGPGLSEVAGEHPWSTLSLLDAGAWHSRLYAGEPLPTLEALARWCRANHAALNIEIKATPGLERHTGEAVARHAARLWHGAPVPPLLSSFDPESLEGARASHPELPRALLLEVLAPNWLEQARALGCVAVVAHDAQWVDDRIAQAHAHGLRALAYTVNDPAMAQRLQASGIDGLITDRIDLFSPASP